MESNEIKCETQGDITTLIGYIAPYDLGATLFDTMIGIEVACICTFGDDCVKADWLESDDGRFANKVVYIDLSSKSTWIKWYYRRKLKNILRKHGVKSQ